MNILYIGQYRNISLNGLYSEVILNNLNQIGKVTSRSIPTERSDKYSNNTILSDNKSYDTYDIIIQHLPVENICYTQKIQKNIIIPILKNSLLSEEDINYLNMFSDVLVDSDLAKDYLDGILDKPTTLYRLRYDDVIKNTNEGISFPSYNQMKKIYTIVNYKYNTEYVLTLISEFISVTLNQENICLIIYMLDTNANEVNEVQSHVSNMQQLCHIHTENIPKVVIAPISCSNNDLCLAHKAGEVFLDLQDYPRNPMNKEIASFYENRYFGISSSNLKLTHVRNGSFDFNGHMIFDVAKLRQITSGNKDQETVTDYSNYNYLDKIL